MKQDERRNAEKHGEIITNRYVTGKREGMNWTDHKIHTHTHTHKKKKMSLTNIDMETELYECSSGPIDYN